MLQAFALGAIAQSSLLLSGIVPFFLRIPDRIIGILAGFGAGALLAAVAFDLVPEAISVAEVAIWFFVGALIFIIADRIIEARFGGEGGGDGGSPLGVVLGSVLTVSRSRSSSGSRSRLASRSVSPSWRRSWCPTSRRR